MTINNGSYKIVFGYLGIFITIIGIITLIPMISLLFYPDELEYGISFLIPSIISFSIGIPLSSLLKARKDQSLSLRQDAIIVILIWIAASAISAMPFIVSGKLNFTQAIFEAVSGWTTTGLSVVNTETLEHIFILHRSIMQFFGGVGIVLVISSALSSTFGMRLYSAEGHSDKLLPNLIKSSRLIMAIYSGYVIAGTLMYVIFGMPLFDAINHSMAALSTGGFGITPNSIADYNSISIEMVTIVLMILGTTNFGAHLLLISGKFKNFFQVGEIRFMFLLLGISIPLISFLSLYELYGSIRASLRVASFQLVSALSTTGFSTINFNTLPPLSLLVIISLMVIGGGLGSTSGGLKLYRVYLIFKTFLWNLNRNFLPRNLIKEEFLIKPSGKSHIDNSEVSEANRYIFIYISFLIIGTGVIASYGYPLDKALFEFASAIGTVGLSIGITTPNTPTLILWTEIIGMFIGRLEIYVVLVGIMKIFKDIRSKF